MNATAPRPHILCIDDDADVLEGLALSLRKLGEVHLASGGAEAMKIAAGLPELAVVICDMRMPVRNGAEVLADFHQAWPDATRLLLTGYADIGDAIAAVNQGRIFRFLSKPCDTTLLQSAVQDALNQHRLVTAEKVLLEQTVKGCVEVLVDGLAIASPAAFGQAQRVRQLVQRLMQRGQRRSSWMPEVAAMLSNLGLVGLRPELQELILLGNKPGRDDIAQIARGHRDVLKLLQRIPRIEAVRDLIRLLEPLAGATLECSPESRPALQRMAQLIDMVRRHVRLEASGLAGSVALMQLRAAGDVPEEWLNALAAEIGDDPDVERTLELPLNLLRAGMILMQPIHTSAGVLMAPAGHQITEGFARRLAEMRPDLRQGRISVRIPPEQAQGQTLRSA